jgi:hypothetical protein
VSDPKTLHLLDQGKLLWSPTVLTIINVNAPFEDAKVTQQNLIILHVTLLQVSTYM